MRRMLFEPEHIDYRESARRFVEKEITPHSRVGARRDRPPRAVHRAAGEGHARHAGARELRRRRGRRLPLQPILGEELGVGRHRRQRARASPCTTTSACRTSSTSATRSRSERWLPGIADGELITAVAMTEPGIGSDLAGMRATARRDGDVYVVNGAKTFITNGINADLVITAVKTDPSQRHAGISLLILERGMHGLRTRAQPREARPARAGHRGAVLRRRSRARSRTCSERRGRAFAT